MFLSQCASISANTLYSEFTEREKASKAATTHFSSSTDEVRSAAAFALYAFPYLVMLQR